MSLILVLNSIYLNLVRLASRDHIWNAEFERRIRWDDYIRWSKNERGLFQSMWLGLELRCSDLGWRFMWYSADLWEISWEWKMVHAEKFVIYGTVTIINDGGCEDGVRRNV